MFILPTYSLSLAYSYLSSVISDISESKTSVVTVIRAEATTEKRERWRQRKEDEEDKVIKIVIREYYLWYDELHV